MTAWPEQKSWKIAGQLQTLMEEECWVMVDGKQIHRNRGRQLEKVRKMQMEEDRTQSFNVLRTFFIHVAVLDTWGGLMQSDTFPRKPLSDLNVSYLFFWCLGSLWVMVLRKYEVADKTAKQQTVLCLSGHNLSSSGFNSRIFSYQLLQWRHTDLRRNQPLSCLLVSLSLMEEGENTEPLISNIPLLGQSSPRILRS